MLKRPLALALCVAAFCTGVYFIAESFFSDSAPPAGSTNLPGTQNATAGQGTAEEPLDQSLKNISLSQGEGGFEIWRLKAEWANVMQQGEKIIVEKPKLTYFEKDDPGKPLYVNSDRGDVEQKSQILRFVTNVRIMQEDRQMEGELLIYNGTSKTMTFPNGARFAGSEMKGVADHFVWDIHQKVITGTGGVDIFFNSGDDGNVPAKQEDTLPR